MAEEVQHHHQHESTVKTDEVAGETKDRGLFDFIGKKKEEGGEKKTQEDVISTEFGKVHVSEHEHKKEEHKEGEKKHGLLEKLSRSDSSSSSSSDEEEVGEGGEKKKKKKGLKEKIKEKISGDHEDGEKKKVEKHGGDSSVPIEKCDEAVHVEPAHPEDEKKGFIDKIKEKLPGQHKKAEDVSPSPRAPECKSPDGSDGEAKGKKGILEKLKEKLPGYHPKTEEEKEKEKESAAH